MTEAAWLIGGIVAVGWIVTLVVTWLDGDDLFEHYGDPFDRRD